MNGVLYFQAVDSAHGQGLWKSDGTEAGTVLVKDIAPGYGLIFWLAKVGASVFFMADDEVHEYELWRSDGTEAGTLLTRDIYPGPGGSFPSDLTEHEGSLYFFASDDYLGSGLWKSDGTEAGTTKVLALSYADYLMESRGELYFISNDGIHGTELWRSDGTAGGTTLVKDIYAGALSAFNLQSFTSPFTDVGGTLYFGADDGIHGIEVWRSDGTTAGTALLEDVNGFNQSYGSSPYELGTIEGTMYFAATNAAHSRNLWRTDGTRAGTTVVKDFGTGYDPGIAGEAVAIGGSLFFVGRDSAHAAEIWKSDGTEEGTVLVKDISTQVFDDYPASSHPLSLVAHDGALVFAADDGIHGYELWRSDGTEAGTFMVKEINPHPDRPATVGWFSKAQGGLVFNADDGVHGRELWRTDGTEAGTRLLKDINPGPSGSFTSLSVTRPALDGSVFFIAFDGTHGQELWKSDGTEAGTVLVKDLCPGSCHGLTSLFTINTAVVGGNLYFGTTDVRPGSDLRNELWTTNGTEEGTALVQDIAPGSTGSGAFFGSLEPTPLGNRILFSTSDDLHGNELWAGRAAILSGEPRRAIDDIGDELAGLDLPRGLERVLSRHLDQAIQALEGPGGAREAIDSMTRFLGKVEVLSRHLITDEERASLVEFAGDIIALLESAPEGGNDGVWDTRGRKRGERLRTAPSAEAFPDTAGLE